MEGLLFLLLMIWLGKNAVKKKKKTSWAKKPDFLDEVVKNVDDDDPVIKGIVKAFTPKKPQVINAHHEPMREGESHMVQTSLFSGEGSEYVGSLHETSTEGQDTCDPMLDHERPILEIEKQSVYAGEIGAPVLDMSPRGLYQGIVMSEILTRPAQRTRRGR